MLTNGSHSSLDSSQRRLYRTIPRPGLWRILGPKQVRDYDMEHARNITEANERDAFPVVTVTPARLSVWRWLWRITVGVLAGIGALTIAAVTAIIHAG